MRERCSQPFQVGAFSKVVSKNERIGGNVLGTRLFAKKIHVLGRCDVLFCSKHFNPLYKEAKDERKMLTTVPSGCIFEGFLQK